MPYFDVIISEEFGYYGYIPSMLSITACIWTSSS